MLGILSVRDNNKKRQQNTCDIEEKLCLRGSEGGKALSAISTEKGKAPLTDLHCLLACSKKCFAPAVSHLDRFAGRTSGHSIYSLQNKIKE